MVCKRAMSSAGSIVNDTKKSPGLANVIPTLLQTLQEADTIDLYFNRANIHEEQVKRAGGILALYLSRDALSAE